MRLRQNNKPRREPDLTGLINVIFLILIFFMIAGTLRPFKARDLRLAKIPQATSATPGPGRLIAHTDGRLTYRNQETTPDALATLIAADTALDRTAPFTLIADARLDARKALALITTLRQVGLSNVTILTERRKP